MMPDLRQITIFSEVPEEFESVIASRIHWIQVPKGTVLFSRGDATDDVYFVLDGILRATTYSFSGKEVSYQDLGCGEMFGELSAIDRGPRTTGIVARKNATVGKMSSADFWHILETHPEVMREVLFKMVGMLRFLVARVYEYSTMGAKDRIRAEIVRYARENAKGGNSSQIENLPTHEELGNMLATHREGVTKEINELVRSGLIEKSGRKISVPDIDRLAALVEEEI